MKEVFPISGWSAMISKQIFIWDESFLNRFKPTGKIAGELWTTLYEAYQSHRAVHQVDRESHELWGQIFDRKHLGTDICGSHIPSPDNPWSMLCIGCQQVLFFFNNERQFVDRFGESKLLVSSWNFKWSGRYVSLRSRFCWQQYFTISIWEGDLCFSTAAEVEEICARKSSCDSKGVTDGQSFQKRIYSGLRLLLPGCGAIASSRSVVASVTISLSAFLRSALWWIRYATVGMCNPAGALLSASTGAQCISICRSSKGESKETELSVPLKFFYTNFQCVQVFVTGSILYGMWLNIEPPFKSFYPIHKFENWFRNFIQVYFYSMCAVQSALFVLKIYSRTFKPVNWAIIFSPAYYTLGAYPCFPAGPLKDYIWCMLLTLLALITIKLSPNESTVGGSVNWLVVVVIPLFCVQGYTFLYNHFPHAPVEQGEIWQQSMYSCNYTRIRTISGTLFESRPSTVSHAKKLRSQSVSHRSQVTVQPEIDIALLLHDCSSHALSDRWQRATRKVVTYNWIDLSCVPDDIFRIILNYLNIFNCSSFTKTLAPILLLVGLSFCYASYQSLSRPRRLRQVRVSVFFW